MTDRAAATVTTHTPIGANVDLERENLHLSDGTRVTDAVADQIVATVRRTAGRPSLSGTAVSSPQIAFRVTPAVRERATQIAAGEGKTLSQLAREALEERVAAAG